MGNIESSDIGSFWDNTVEGGSREGVGGAYFRDEDVHREDYYRNYEDESGNRTPANRTPVRTPARTAPPSPAPNLRTTESKPEKGSKLEEEATAPLPATEEIVTDVTADRSLPEEAHHGTDAEAELGTNVSNELNISKTQKTHHVAAEATTKSADGGTTAILKESRVQSPLCDVPFGFLFVLHLVLVTAGILYLNIVYLRNMNPRKLHNLERWFPQLGAAVLTGGCFATLCQLLFRRYPTVMVRSIIWVSSILTFGVALMLVSTSTAANLGVGVLFIIFSICQSLYACWVSNRIKYAADLLFCSLHTAKKVHGIYLISFWVLLVASVWAIFWSFGVVSALTFKLAPLVILAMLASLAWTLEILRNVVSAATGRGVASVYLGAAQPPWDRSLHSAFTSWFGSICLGSLIVPVLHMMRVMARGLNRIHGDNEFMFSCADCFYHVTHSFTMYANNWAYVQVALHRKPFVRASRDTFSLFNSKRLDLLIEKDLTSSFCVLSGISGGMLCAIVSGGWTFGTHKALTSSVSVISFFIGYFLVRITMAVPQGAVCAHYVCFGENPASQELLSSPIPERLKELLADIDTEVAKG